MPISVVVHDVGKKELWQKREKPALKFFIERLAISGERAENEIAQRQRKQKPMRTLPEEGSSASFLQREVHGNAGDKKQQRHKEIAERYGEKKKGQRLKPHDRRFDIDDPISQIRQRGMKRNQG